MATATGSIAVWQGAFAIKTRKAVVRPPSSIGPILRLFICSNICASNSFSFLSSDRKRALLARRAEPSNVLPTPSPTIIGGHGLPPLSHTVLSTNEATSCVGSSIAKALTFSEPARLTSTVTIVHHHRRNYVRRQRAIYQSLLLLSGPPRAVLTGLNWSLIERQSQAPH